MSDDDEIIEKIAESLEAEGIAGEGFTMEEMKQISKIIHRHLEIAGEIRDHNKDNPQIDYPRLVKDIEMGTKIVTKLDNILRAVDEDELFEELANMEGSRSVH